MAINDDTSLSCKDTNVHVKSLEQAQSSASPQEQLKAEGLSPDSKTNHDASTDSKPLSSGAEPETATVEETSTPTDKKEINVQEIKITRVAPGKWRQVKKEGKIDTQQSILLTSATGNGVLMLPETRRRQNRSIDAAGSSTSGTSNRLYKPHRLAINSKFLLRVLEECTGTSFSEEQNVMVRPFKYLVEFEPELREALENAEAQCAKADAELGHCMHESEGNNSPSHTSATSHPTEGSLERCKEAAILKERERDELRCLLEFMDTDMRDIFDMKSRIQARSLEKIAFEHLWLFFNPGDLTYRSLGDDDKRQQAYQVLHVTGGRVCFEKRRKFSFDPVGDRQWDSDSEDDEKACDSVRCSGTERTSFIIDAFYLDSDGRTIAPKGKRFVISPYIGERSIFSFPLQHLDFDPQKQQIQTELLNRGTRFIELISRNRSVNSNHKMYSGATIQEARFVAQSWKCYNIPSTEVYNEVMIDQEAGLQHFQQTFNNFRLRVGGRVITSPTLADTRECIDVLTQADNDIVSDIFEDSEFELARRQEFIHSTNIVDIRLIANTSISDNDRVLFPPRVYGYSLLNHRWAAFNIKLLTDLSYSRGKDGWAKMEDLVLPDDHKTMLQALVTNQFQQNPPSADGANPHNQFSMDVVPGKGAGLIILLHGAPGVGKTSTAECIAAKLNRPLLPVTCGDIGTYATAAEANLETFCNLADRWKCVLLLDEADVFLAKRERGDIERNSLVSVFLRVLEYFSGVIILTTNRVGEFDEAFRSRIHICLYYPKLGQEQAKQIWQKNIQRLKSSRLDIEIDAKEIEKFADEHWQRNLRSPSRHWNGRQIKNAFQTAIALANWEFQENSVKKRSRPVLKVRHFRKVAKLAGRFDDYISEIYDLPEVDAYGELAKRDGIREDNTTIMRQQFQPPQDDLRRERRRSRPRGSINVTRHREVDQHSSDDSDDSFGSHGEESTEAESTQDEESDSDDDSDKIKQLELELKLKKMKDKKKKAKRQDK
ncbi:uncharacterized protein N7479_002313 [Penicillium vulpinum]|uniref:AAA+ ATPase domain-containing protein n=1 Tax=Penicillium vulpinum TaxID=29845 RepID=A0A1V6S7I9_9EURO|nr:uncharacterized protein N7479_002313 [Penicillium vulpinum]KAJ5972395.1 hypothetical protein N7479_002313 [Penicillium vulpinum]OQE10021.1 hypothetical protein PENVUL_c005G03785 [Penicillium vulpinum]